MAEMCNICGEEVNGPCESVDEARADGCINPPQLKRGVKLDPKIAQRVADQQKDLHGKSSGPGSFTN